ncbi:hypothetical protein SAMD00019534_000590 [Acytostelium subglobosum LB1]|uniref:hypothetical protein n=1 Tax=Acytostelium subglobosum LB1 TaxID=1410327 RepID=UPI000644EDEF|nr:hypothetical protein SAMD00019534_000590 [Acytostelium subglobosum LB1]GAM16884.1 hypothetical protein SAMD00019534_000590 [Acytostelium subglobosum LB1]|eukprot:XP_012758946.1 hypothetical protein SAMD00019534_000590 [Acytostelium subglobosum LB1]
MGHEYAELDKVRQSNQEHMGPAIDRIWTLVRQHVGMIRHHEEQERSVHRFFEQLYNFIMVEEKKVSKPFQQQRDKSMARLDELLGHIDKLTSTMSTPPTYTVASDENHHLYHADYDSVYQEYLSSLTNGGRDDDSDGDLDQHDQSNTTQSLQSLPAEQLKALVDKHQTITDFIQSSRLQEVVGEDNDKDKDKEKDITTLPSNVFRQLLKLEAAEFALETDNDEEDILCGFGFDASLLEKLKADLKNVYEVDFSSAQSVATPPRSQLYSQYRLSSIYLLGGYDYPKFHPLTFDIYDLATDDWTSRMTHELFTPGSFTPFTNPFMSAVNTGDRIYLFGGDAESSHYFVYDLKAKAWEKPIARRLLSAGGMGISACYDGQRYIHLTGGYSHQRCLDRVDRFDVSTGEFILNVGKLVEPLYNAFTFWHDSHLFVIGGWHDRREGTNNPTLAMYHLSTNNILSTISNNNDNSNNGGGSLKDSQGSGSGSGSGSISNSISEQSLVSCVDLKCTSGVERACFDPIQGNVYYMGSDEVLFRINVETEKVEILQPVPLSFEESEKGIHGASLIFGMDNNNGSNLHLIGGNINFVYQVSSATWKRLQSPPTDSTWQSATGVTNSLTQSLT